jgi:hypothetical protein
VSEAGPEVLEAAFEKHCKRGQRTNNLACIEEQAGNDHVITEADENALEVRSIRSYEGIPGLVKSSETGYMTNL